MRSCVWPFPARRSRQSLSRRFILPRPLRLEAAGAVYHVIARGNERKAIFRDDHDRIAYLERLAECRARLDFRLYAFCLMGNHLHLALQRGSVPLSRIMLTLHSSYSQRFNRKHGRVSHLFQGRYKSFLVEKEGYLLALLRYIHLNPVRAQIVSTPRGYRWSSDRYYRVGRGPDWLDVDDVLQILAPQRSEAVARYRRLVDGAAELDYTEAGGASPAVQGSEAFATRALSGASSSYQLKPDWTVEVLVEGVAAAFGLTGRALQGRRRGNEASLARAVAAFLGRSEAGIPIARTARYLARDESTLVRVALKLETAMAADPLLANRVRTIAASLRGADA